MGLVRRSGDRARAARGAALLVVASVVAACGGSGGASPSAPAPLASSGAVGAAARHDVLAGGALVSTVLTGAGVQGSVVFGGPVDFADARAELTVSAADARRVVATRVLFAGGTVEAFEPTRASRPWVATSAALLQGLGALQLLADPIVELRLAEVARQPVALGAPPPRSAHASQQFFLNGFDLARLARVGGPAEQAVLGVVSGALGSLPVDLSGRAWVRDGMLVRLELAVAGRANAPSSPTTALPAGAALFDTRFAAFGRSVRVPLPPADQVVEAAPGPSGVPGAPGAGG
jgi:hypothetical protein